MAESEGASNFCAPVKGAVTSDQSFFPAGGQADWNWRGIPFFFLTDTPELLGDAPLQFLFLALPPKGRRS